MRKQRLLSFLKITITIAPLLYVLFWKYNGFLKWLNVAKAEVYVLLSASYKGQARMLHPSYRQE